MNAAGGYWGAENGAVCCVSPDRAAVVLEGSDAQKFADQVTSGPVSELAPGSGCYSALLEPKGKYIADLKVFHLGERILLDCPAAAEARVREVLASYRFRSKVRFGDDSPGWHLLSVQGSEAVSVAGLPQLASHDLSVVTVPDDSALCAARVSESPFGGVWLWVDPDAVTETLQLLERAGAHVATDQALRTLRILSGTPSWGVDIDESVLPHEAGQDRALSYNKCYPGQEVIARIHFRGHVNRFLMMLDIDSDCVPEAGSEVTGGGAPAGRVTSAALDPQTARAAALAYVKREAFLQQCPLLVQCGSGSAAAVAKPLPYHTPA